MYQIRKDFGGELGGFSRSIEREIGMGWEDCCEVVLRRGGIGSCVHET
jgi:hypothetical protein